MRDQVYINWYQQFALSAIGKTLSRRRVIAEDITMPILAEASRRQLFSHLNKSTVEAAENILSRRRSASFKCNGILSAAQGKTNEFFTRQGLLSLAQNLD